MHTDTDTPQAIPSQDAGEQIGGRATGYGIDARRLLRHLDIDAGHLPTLIAASGLPAPTESAVWGWVARGTITSNWLAVILLALKRRGIRVDIADFIKVPE